MVYKTDSESKLAEMLSAKQAPLTHLKGNWTPEQVEHTLKEFQPKDGLARLIVKLQKQVMDFAREHGLPVESDMMMEILNRVTASASVTGSIAIQVLRGPNSRFGQPFAIEDYGWVSHDLVTTAGKDFIATRMAGTSAATIADFKYEGIGTSSTAAAVGNTALVAELTTEYTTNNTRNSSAATQSNPSTAVYRVICINTVDSTVTIREVGLFTSATVGSGTIFDRTVVSDKTLDSGDGIQVTTDITIA